MTRLLFAGWAFARATVENALADWNKNGAFSVIPFSSPDPVAAAEADIVIGWSLGGLKAIRAILDGAIQPSGLVLISSTARFCRDHDYPCGVERAALRSMMVGMRRNRAETLSGFFRDAAQPENIDATLLAQRMEQAEAFSNDELLRGLRDLDTLDVRPELASLALPVLVLHGAHDRIIPPSAAAHMADRLDRATLHIHPDAGHELLLKQPEWVREAVDRFAAGL